MRSRSDQGLLVVLSGPSGSGKDTVLGELCKTADNLELSVSLTSRERRPWEFDGTHYYFVTREYFEEKLRAGEILEHTQYNGNYYGTPKASIDEWLALGKTVILEIEVEGAARIRAIYPDCVSVFLLPPSLEVLEQRLHRRESENGDEIARRT
ncbi:MAG: guanylate kinase, partial [Oscillospiraceae bacterium]|nr:guanylate kinase [Oscillospiraceae bacterium]